MHLSFAKQDEKLDAFSSALEVLQSEFGNMKTCFNSLRTDLDSLIDSSHNLHETNTRNAEVLKETIDSLNVLENVVKEYSNSSDLLSGKIDAMQSDYASCKSVISDLKSNSVVYENNLKALQNKVLRLERISRSYNIELQAIPERKGENLLDIVKALLEKINVSFSDDIIISCSRVGRRKHNSNRPRNVVVTLTSAKLRDTILSAVHRYNKANPTDMLNTIHLRIAGEARPIYVVENLTSVTRNIYMEARKASKTLNYQFVWIRSDKVFMRKNEHSPAIIINSLDKIQKLS